MLMYFGEICEENNIRMQLLLRRLITRYVSQLILICEEIHPCSYIAYRLVIVSESDQPTKIV
jgi:ABC-type taurine transport system ATPase subunit